MRLKEKWFFNNLDAFYMGRFDVTGDKIAAIHPVAQNSVYGVALKLAAVVGLDPQSIEIVSHAVGTEALPDCFFKDHPYNSRLRFVDLNVHEFLALLIAPAAFHQSIPERRHTAGINSLCGQLPNPGFDTGGGLAALAVRLPEAHIIHQVVHIIFKALLSFLGTPHLNALTNKPLHHKWCLVLLTAQAIKHIHQQDIEFLSFGCGFQILNSIPIIGGNLIAGNSFFIKLLDDNPAVSVGKFTGRLLLHRYIVLDDLTFGTDPV